jgi:two-component system, chemotaxis family, response regulator Rcp1
MIGANFDARVIDILLVEDNAGDARLAREALRDGKVRNALHHVWEGEEAMAFLRRTGKHTAAPRPDLILLDLNLPRMNGNEVLAEIKRDDSLKSIPVVILTTSSNERDILRSYNLHANCYITKPVTMVEFIRAVTAVQDFWLTVVKLPTSAPSA